MPTTPRNAPKRRPWPPMPSRRRCGSLRVEVPRCSVNVHRSSRDRAKSLGPIRERTARSALVCRFHRGHDGESRHPGQPAAQDSSLSGSPEIKGAARMGSDAVSWPQSRLHGADQQSPARAQVESTESGGDRFARACDAVSRPGTRHPGCRHRCLGRTRVVVRAQGCRGGRRRRARVLRCRPLEIEALALRQLQDASCDREGQGVSGMPSAPDRSGAREDCSLGFVSESAAHPLSDNSRALFAHRDRVTNRME